MKSLLSTIALTAVMACSSAQAVTIQDELTVSSTFQSFAFFVNSAEKFDISADPTFSDLVFVLYPYGSSSSIAGPADHFDNLSLAAGLYDLQYASPIYSGSKTMLTIQSVLATVPLPAGLPLLAGAFGVFGVLRRRRRAA